MIRCVCELLRQEFYTIPCWIYRTEIIAVFFSDVITDYQNPLIAGYPTVDTLFYRSGFDPLPADASRMARDVAESFPNEAPFSATFLFVATWFAVAPYFVADNSYALNTFQVCCQMR